MGQALWPTELSRLVGASVVAGDIQSGVAADRAQDTAVTILPLALTDLAVEAAAAAGAVHGLVVAAGTFRVVPIVTWHSQRLGPARA